LGKLIAQTEPAVISSPQMESYLRDAMANYRQEYIDITWRRVKVC
jgi:hypothetical protein